VDLLSFYLKFINVLFSLLFIGTHKVFNCSVNPATLKMSAAHDQVKKRRPPKVFLISTDLKVQDELDGTILLQRGWICHEQDSGRNRGDSSWVKVLTHINLLKMKCRIHFSDETIRYMN